MNTTENNKLIAEFMGYVLNDNTGVTVYYNDKTCEVLDPDKLKFHSDWNWLMEVVEKIENLGFEVVIGRISCNVNEILNRENPITSIVCGNPSKKLEVVYSSICQFIQWHNQQNQ